MADVETLTEEVDEIKAELGNQPQGIYSNVRVRLDVLETRLGQSPNPIPGPINLINNPVMFGSGNPDGYGVTIEAGDGAPSGSANPGSLYLRTDGYNALYSYRDGYDAWVLVTSTGGGGGGGNQTLSQVLDEGNTTSGFDIIVSAGDFITITDAPATGTSAANKAYVDGYVAANALANGSSAGGDLTGTYPNPTVTTNAVSNAKFRQSAALSVVGRSANSTGNVADISTTTGTDGVLRESGGTLGFGTVATGGIANNAVTVAKIQTIATDSLLGRDTTGTGNVEVIGLNATLGMDGAGNLQRSALTGDVTASAGSNATTIANNVVSDAKLRQSAALSVVGRSANSTGNVADISTTNASAGVLRESGGTIGFGTVATAGIANNAVTFGKIQTVATDSLLGRDTTGTGDVENITLNATLSMDGAGNLQRAALTGDVTASAGSNATTIATNVVSDAKFRQSAALSVVGRSANSTGNVADISTTNASAAVLRESGGTIGFGTIATAGITNNAVDNTKIRQSAALSVIGRSANSTGNVADISATASTDAVLRESGGTVGFGTIATAGIADSAVTDAKTNFNILTVNEQTSAPSATASKGKITFLQASGDGYQLPRPVAVPNDGYTGQVLAPYADYDFAKQTTGNTLLQALNLSLSDNTVYSFGIRITAKQASSSNVLVRETAGLVHRIGGGAATILGTLTDSNYFRSDSNWATNATVSGNSFLVTVTGVAATTINWRIQVWVSAVAYI